MLCHIGGVIISLSCNNWLGTVPRLFHSLKCSTCPLWWSCRTEYIVFLRITSFSSKYIWHVVSRPRPPAWSEQKQQTHVDYFSNWIWLITYSWLWKVDFVQFYLGRNTNWATDKQTVLRDVWNISLWKRRRNKPAGTSKSKKKQKTKPSGDLVSQ